MLARRRLLALGATTLLLASTLVSLSPPAAATGGRDSPAAAVDATTGPFLGLFDRTVFVQSQPAPVVEDWYKMNVWEGQILQLALYMGYNGRVTVYHPDGCSASGCTQEIANSGIFIDNFHCGFGVSTLDLIIQKTELIYIKISPSNAAGTQYYNLAVRGYNATEITSGGSVTPSPNANSIHGWAYSVLTYNAQGDCVSIWVPERFLSDYYWINVSDSTGPNHQTYRVQLSYTCATAMFDMYLTQLMDLKGVRTTPLNHSLTSARRDSRSATSTGPISFDFAPVLYDGRYLLEVYAVENGSFNADGTNPWTYAVSVNPIGGYAKDDNDRPSQGAFANTTVKLRGRIDGRDDSGDWFQIPSLRNDSISIGITLDRENSEIVTLAQRYRALVFAPNGTVVRDAVNWGYQGPNLVFSPYISIATFQATEDGIYTLLLLTADGALTTLNVARATGWVGRNWANYEVNFILPNRPPVQLSPLPDIIIDEDTSGSIDLGPFFYDPEGRMGYPPFTVALSQNFTFGFTGTTLSITPVTDWNGGEIVTVNVRDDFGHILYIPLNVTVLPVNDAPRVWNYAAVNWSSTALPEDSETTVNLWGIFHDVDDVDLEFTAGGVSGGHMAVEISTSGFVTVTPFANWNGCQSITWTATDSGFLTASFVSDICVSAVNDPPRATDRRLDRIVFNEGSEFSLNLSGEFYDLDGDSLRYYGIIDDPVVSQFVRINNSLLTPFDPVMRIFVLDSQRSSYFTDGPVQVRFFVLDAFDNMDFSQGVRLDVEKTTFLEILNVNDPPLLDDYSPREDEVNLTAWHEGDTITFSVTSVVDSDREGQFFFKWFVNGEEGPQEGLPTFVFNTVLDRTRPGQYDAGNYTVSVQVFDAAGAKAIREPTWEFQVAKTNPRPTVTIVRPTLPTFEEGSNIDLQAFGSDDDPEDAAALRISWSYVDAAGKTHALGSGGSVQTMLDPGTYRVTVSASDGTVTENRTITVTVNEHRLNTPGFEVGGAAPAGLVVAAASAGRRLKD